MLAEAAAHTTIRARHTLVSGIAPLPQGVWVGGRAGTRRAARRRGGVIAVLRRQEDDVGGIVHSDATGAIHVALRVCVDWSCTVVCACELAAGAGVSCEWMRAILNRRQPCNLHWPQKQPAELAAVGADGKDPYGAGSGAGRGAARWGRTHLEQRLADCDARPQGQQLCRLARRNAGRQQVVEGNLSARA